MKWSIQNSNDDTLTNAALLIQHLVLHLRMLWNTVTSNHMHSFEVTHALKDVGAFGREAHQLLGKVLLGHVIAEEAAKAYLAHLGGMCSSSLRGHVFFGRDEDLDAFVLEEVVYRIEEDVFVFCSTWALCMLL